MKVHILKAHICTALGFRVQVLQQNARSCRPAAGVIISSRKIKVVATLLARTTFTDKLTKRAAFILRRARANINDTMNTSRTGGITLAITNGSIFSLIPAFHPQNLAHRHDHHRTSALSPQFHARPHDPNDYYCRYYHDSDHQPPPFCRRLVSKSVLADSAFLNSRLCSMSAMICHDVGLESLGVRHDREPGVSRGTDQERTSCPNRL